MLPKIASSYIALVGVSPANPVMTRINDYLVPLQQYWAANQVNNLTLQYYPDMESLKNYIGSTTYLFPDEGICFGISVTQNADGEYDA